MAIDRPKKLTIIDELAGDIGNPQLIVAATELTDQIVLESIRDEIERERQTLGATIMALIADAILRLGIKKGSEMVLPIAGVVSRTINNLEVGSTTLVDLRTKLTNAQQPSSRFSNGLYLGDMGTHFAAGYTGNGHIKNVMGDSELHKYARGMARLGYHTAIDSAPRCENPKAINIAESVNQLIHRFRELIDILTLVLNTNTIEDIRRRQSLKGVTPAAC